MATHQVKLNTLLDGQQSAATGEQIAALTQFDERLRLAVRSSSFSVTLLMLDDDKDKASGSKSEPRQKKQGDQGSR